MWRTTTCGVYGVIRLLFRSKIIGQHKLPFSKEFTSGLASLKLEYGHNTNPNIFEHLLKLGIVQLLAALFVIEAI